MDSSLHSLFLSYLFIFHFHTSEVVTLFELSFSFCLNLSLRNLGETRIYEHLYHFLTLFQ